MEVLPLFYKLIFPIKNETSFLDSEKRKQWSFWHYFRFLKKGKQVSTLSEMRRHPEGLDEWWNERKSQRPLFKICQKKRFVPFSRNQRQVKGEKLAEKGFRKGAKKCPHCLRLTHRFQKFWLEGTPQWGNYLGREAWEIARLGWQ